MTLVEYGKLTITMVRNQPSIVIECTAPIGILEKLSKLEENVMKMEVHKDSRVFVDVPEELWE